MMRSALLVGALSLASGLVPAPAPRCPRLQPLAGAKSDLAIGQTMDAFAARQMETLDTDRPIFSSGDTVNVACEITEGNTKRIQNFAGVVIKRSGGGVTQTFTVRKMSSGIGVERTFPLYSPTVKGISVIRRGSVRRSKLYYLRGLTGKSARIKEKVRGLAYVERQEAAIAEKKAAALQAAADAKAAEEAAAAAAKAAEEAAAKAEEEAAAAAAAEAEAAAAAEAEAAADEPAEE